MSIISNHIDKAVEILKDEDIIGLPTETVYGLAGNIYSEKAIRKIFEVKQRPLYNPLIVHLHSMGQLNEIVKNVPSKAKKLAEVFWPGPLTLILEKNCDIPDLITAGKKTVAVRIPNHTVALELLRKLPFPIAAPSANPFNRISPTSAQHVENYFKDDIKLVLDGGSCKNGLESTIVAFENKEPIILRLGSISIEDIEKTLGKVKIKNKNETTPDAPGMLSKHYSPSTNTYLTSNIRGMIEKHKHKNMGVLYFSTPLKSENIQHFEVLSKSGNLNEAASNLYQALHQLDSMNLDIILAEKAPDIGLGKSINDRLERATK